jgi:hypothetical protein
LNGSAFAIKCTARRIVGTRQIALIHCRLALRFWTCRIYGPHPIEALSGSKKWELMIYVIAGNFTFVTRNSQEFRASDAHNPGALHAEEPIHVGPICLNSDL